MLIRFPPGIDNAKNIIICGLIFTIFGSQYRGENEVVTVFSLALRREWPFFWATYVVYAVAALIAAFGDKPISDEEIRDIIN